MVEVLDGLLQLDEQARRRIGQEGRQRILDNYPIEKIIRQYENLWNDLASSRKANL